MDDVIIGMISSVVCMAQTTVMLIVAAALGVSGVATGMEPYRDAMVVHLNVIQSFALGGFLFIDAWNLDVVKAHEYGHYEQEQQLGALYLPIVALPSVALNVAVILGLVDPRSYFLSWPESWADELGGVKR